MLKLQQIISNNDYSLENIAYLLAEDDIEKRKLIRLYSKTNKKKFKSDYHNSERVVEISNHCDANCVFCQARNANYAIPRYRLNREEIIERVIQLYKKGSESVLLHSGYDDFYNSERIAYIVYSIKKMTNIKVTLSLGLREYDEYKEWKIAGADSYFLNFVTSNSKLYKNTKSWGLFNDRLQHIDELKNLGFNVGTGSIIGLPEQNINDLANDIYLCKNLNVDYIDFCHYNFTSSNNSDLPSEEFIRRGVSVAQLVNGNKNVRLNNLIN
jgi:biotin synthase